LVDANLLSDDLVADPEILERRLPEQREAPSSVDPRQ
jgi:hypothetical protein